MIKDLRPIMDFIVDRAVRDASQEEVLRMNNVLVVTSDGATIKHPDCKFEIAGGMLHVFGATERGGLPQAAYAAGAWQRVCVEIDGWDRALLVNAPLLLSELKSAGAALQYVQRELPQSRGWADRDRLIESAAKAIALAEARD